MTPLEQLLEEQKELNRKINIMSNFISQHETVHCIYALFDRAYAGHPIAHFTDFNLAQKTFRKTQNNSLWEYSLMKRDSKNLTFEEITWNTLF